MQNPAYEHPPITGSVGFFISPESVLFRVEGGSHISTVIKNPSKFGLTIEQIRNLYEFFGEKLGSEGLARKQILTHLVRQGWIRLRRYPNKYWSVNTDELNSQTAGILEDWAAKFLVGFAGFREPDPYMPVLVTDCFGNVSRLSIKEISDRALPFTNKDSLEARTRQITFIENAASLPDIAPLPGDTSRLPGK